MIALKIVGLFFVVVGSFTINRLIGFEEPASVIGVIVAAGSYILLNVKGA